MVDGAAEFGHTLGMLTATHPPTLPPERLLDGYFVAKTAGLPALTALCQAVLWSLPATAVILALCLLAADDRRTAFAAAAWAKAVSAPFALAAWVLTAAPAAGWGGPVRWAFVTLDPAAPAAALAAALALMPAAHGLVCVGVEWAVLRRIDPARPGLLRAVARANLYGTVVVLLALGTLFLNRAALPNPLGG